jgi:outer membrane protein OmpA-like peptidoglycan-associated protein
MVSAEPLQIQNATDAGVGGLYQVEFEFGSDTLGAVALSGIDKIVVEASRGHAVAVQIIASDTESWSPQRRQDITNARIRAVTDALADRGIQRSRIGITWTPSLSDTGMLRDGPGHQIFAKLSISKP